MFIVHALSTPFAMFWEILWALILGFALSGVVQAVVSKKEMTLHEQTGMYAPLIAESQEPDPIRSDRDYAVLLSDWADDNPLHVFLNLKKMGGYYNFRQPTVGDFFVDVSRIGLAAATTKRRMWNRSRMNPTDFSDVSGVTYTYLMNGTPPAGNWTAVARRGRARARAFHWCRHRHLLRRPHSGPETGRRLDRRTACFSGGGG